MNVTIGSDPEIFIANSKKELVSAEGLIGRGKDNPLPFTDGFFIQEDNVMLEFNTPPTNSKKDFTDNHLFILSAIENEYLTPNNLQFNYQSSGNFKPEELLTEQALQFGCEPDYSIYPKIQKNKAPKGEDTTLRTCGGHLHYGYSFNSRAEFKNKIKMLDFFVGLPLMVLDKDSERTKLYGKAGCFREKPYGLEYRTPSNIWLRKASYMDYVFDQSQEAFKSKMSISHYTWERITQAINTSNVELATELLLNQKVEIIKQ